MHRVAQLEFKVASGVQRSVVAKAKTRQAKDPRVFGFVCQWQLCPISFTPQTCFSDVTKVFGYQHAVLSLWPQLNLRLILSTYN